MEFQLIFVELYCCLVDVLFNNFDESFNFGVKLRPKISTMRTNLFEIIHRCRETSSIVPYLIRPLKSRC